MAKALEAFRNIGEVSVELGIKKHVLRFWELKFPQLKPMKRGGGRRLYRPSDVELLRGIRDLLQDAGYTIKGVQRLLREHGIERVKSAAESGPGSAGRSQVRQRPPTPVPSVVARPMLFSAQEVAALRAVMAELEACRSLLAGSRDDKAAPRRGRAAD